MAGLVESAQSSAQLKGHLLQKLAELMGIISTLEVIGSLGTSYAMHLQCGYDHLMVSHQGSNRRVALLHACIPIECILVHHQTDSAVLCQGLCHTRGVGKGTCTQ